MSTAFRMGNILRAALAAGSVLMVIALATLPTGCQLTPGGGTDVGNPEMSIRVTGSIRHMDGSPGSGIPLHLRPSSHLGTPDTAEARAPSDSFQQDGRTDTQGFFTFDSVPKGVYRIEAMDTNGRGAVIELDADGKTANLTLNPAILDSTGSITGHINYLRTITVGYPKITIAVYGMDRATFATKDGNYTLSDLPPGKHKVRITDNSDTTLTIVLPDITLVAGQNVTAGSVDLGP